MYTLVLPNDELVLYLENRIREWEDGVGLRVWWEHFEVNLSSRVACNVELGFIEELCLLGCCILMPFDMLQFDGKWYPVDCLEDFMVKIIVVTDGPGWIKNVNGLHHVDLLDEAEIITITSDCLGAILGKCWIVVNIVFQEGKCCK